MKDEHALHLRAREPGNEIGAEEVLAYLARHPDFFLRHEQALADLQLPHRAGAAVSLVERQVSLLRERNIDSRQRLNRLLETARDNDALFSRTRRLVLSLLEADSLHSLSRALGDALRRDFGVDHARLLFVEGARDWPAGVELLPQDVAASSLPALFAAGRPIVGPLRPRERALLFAAQAEDVLSAAVVPVGGQQTVAVLAAGSSDARRFHGEMGTMFLEFIGEVISRLLQRLTTTD